MNTGSLLFSRRRILFKLVPAADRRHWSLLFTKLDDESLQDCFSAIEGRKPNLTSRKTRAPYTIILLAVDSQQYCWFEAHHILSPMQEFQLQGRPVRPKVLHYSKDSVM